MITAPRGAHDVLPGEQPRWRRVIGEFEQLCAQYGYGRIDTPVIEHRELIERTSGEGSDIVQKEIYTLQDRSGRELAIRPEATAPVARAYVEHGLQREPQPVKTYMVAPMLRYDRPQKGRYRQHWQLNVEAIGSADPAVDAEVIQLYDELLRRLGIRRYWLELNSIGDRSCRPAYLEQLEAWLDAHDELLTGDARQKRQTSPLRVFDVKDERLQAALAEAPKIGDSLCAECEEHFAEVRRYLEAYGVEYRITPTLVRGLDYYSRTAFEFKGMAMGAAGTICGGGRYDYLVEEIGGPPTPGVGFGAGIERLLIQLEEEGVEAAARNGVDVFFAYEDGAPRDQLLRVMADLRRAGRACETDYAGRSLRGQLTQAGRVGAETVVIAKADAAVVRRRGQDDVEVAYDGLREALV
jgi:histidyl-tRNA synthetase